MRKKIVAGNWKMNKSVPEGINLAKEINYSIRTSEDAGKTVTVIVAPPHSHLTGVHMNLAPAFAAMAGQDCATEASGAYTGEVSADMLASAHCEYVILGHSERRNYYGETDAILVKKVAQALKSNLGIIFCVGEALAEREAAKHFEVVKSQIVNGLFHLTAAEFSNIILAYEPVWAIGTGKTATSAQAQEMHAFIRGVVSEKYGETVANDTSILYGGSCNAKNADELFTNPDVDGGLIGGASLKSDEFQAIINARAKH